MANTATGLGDPRCSRGIGPRSTCRNPRLARRSSTSVTVIQLATYRQLAWEQTTLGIAMNRPPSVWKHTSTSSEAVRAPDECSDPCGDSAHDAIASDLSVSVRYLGSCNSPDSRPRGEVSLWSSSIANETFIQSGWAISHARRLVSSRIEPAQSSCSTHMYNCRRARFGATDIAIALYSAVLHLER